MSNAAGEAEGFHVVVADDGSLPSSELARVGVRPGERLRLVPEPRRAARRRMAGALANAVPAEAVEALERGLAESKAERAFYYHGPFERQ